MLKKNLHEALNDQLNFELYSGYIYLSMAQWFKSVNLPGFARWMEVQTLEEYSHAMKFAGYLADRGATVTLAAVPQPKTAWESPLAAFETTLHHERVVTGRINDLVTLALKEKDHATTAFLQWFVTEQVEEEANAEGIIARLKLTENAPGALYALDQELGSRVFAVPPGTTILGAAKKA